MPVQERDLQVQEGLRGESMRAPSEKEAYKFDEEEEAKAALGGVPHRGVKM